MQSAPNIYVGIDRDIQGGMTATGKIVRDAWVFGLIPEDETCAGWNAQGIESLWVKVDAEWEKYGFSVGALPPELRERFMRIQEAAFAEAKAAGWDPDQELGDD